MKKSAAFVIWLCLAASLLLGGEQESGQPIPLDANVVIRKLENGLTYYIRKNGKPEKRAEIQLAVNAGSILEEEDQRGLAHFLEHMAFNGTENFEKQDLLEYIQSIGMRFGADLNAYTSFDETVYTLQVPTDKPEILEKAFLILSDWAHRISLDPVEIDKERGVVVEEWRMGRGAQARINDKQFPVLLHGSRYAERLPIGSKEVIETAPQEALTRFYRDWYRSDLMAVVVVGDIDPDEIEKLIRKNLGSIPVKSNPKPRSSFPVPGHEQTLFSIETDPELSRSSVQIAYKHDPIPSETLADFRQSVVRRLNLGLLNQRLYERTKEENPPYIFAYTTVSNFVREKALFVQSAQVKENGFDEGLTALLFEAVRAERYGFTQSELDRQKIDLMRGLERAYAERDKTESSNYVYQYVSHFLEGTTIPGIENLLDLYKTYLPGISLEEVNRAADHLITDKNRVITVTAPEKEGANVPSESEIVAMIDKVGKMEITPYRDSVSDAPLVAAKPKPGAVTQSRHLEEIGVWEWTLSNGIRLVLKPTDFKNDEIRLSSFSPGGSSLVPEEDHVAAVTAISLIEESGLGSFDSLQLEKKLTGKVVGVSPYIGELHEGFRGSASPQDVETLFQLIYLYFTEPKVTGEAFKSVQTRWKSYVENRDANPMVVFGDEISEKLYQNHPRRQPFTLETLEKMDAEKSLRIYKDRFADAGDFTFVLVGNFEPEKLKPLVETWLGSLPNLGRNEKWKNVGVATVKGRVDIKVYKGLEPKSLVRIIFTGDAEWNAMNNYVFSAMNEALQIKFREVLREDMGGVYGVSVFGGIQKNPVASYNATISFGCDPDKVDILVKTVFEELSRIVENGLDASYIDKVKESQLRAYEVSLKRNGFWLNNLNYRYTYQLDPTGILRYKEEGVEKLTPALVREAVTKYFSSENVILGVLYPAENKPETGN